MGSNGLTSARHDVFHKKYRQLYPESYDPGLDDDLAYSGSYNLTDLVPGVPLDIGKLVLSPTRTYAPMMNLALKQMREEIHGVIHCSGGAQTKILNFIDKLEIVKDNMFPVPPLFEIIQKESKTGWKEMYQVFNMGHRLEFYLPDQYAQEIIDIAGSFNINAQVIGKVRKAEAKQVTINNEKGNFVYP